MKQVFLTGLLIATITCHNTTPFTSPGKDSGIVSRDPVANETIAGNWQLQPVLASDTSTGKVPTINFDIATHRFSGNTGCNSMSGNFKLKADALVFDEQIISTKMACAGYNEKAFLDNLIKTNRYQIKEGVLQLMYNTTILSNWVRHADTSTTRQL